MVVKCLGTSKRKKKKRKYFSYKNIGLKRRSFLVHDNNLKNLLHALVERVFLTKAKNGDLQPPPPVPWVGARKGETEFSGNQLRDLKSRLIEYVAKHCVSRMSNEQFVRSCPAHKRKLYKAALKALHTEGWKDTYSNINVFTKFEKIDCTDKTPVPRVISPRHPVYNLVLGTFLRPIEKLIYQGLDELCGGPTVMKNYNAVETGTIIASAFQEVEALHGQAFVLSLDASRFDQHVSQEALQFEHSIYNGVYKAAGLDKPQSDLLARLLRAQKVTKGSATIQHEGVDYKVNYTRNGGRCSGDMNTSLGNIVLMVLMTKIIFDRIMGKTRYRIINNGDDCLVILPGTYDSFMSRGGFAKEYLKFGFNVKEEAQHATIIERVGFCQSRPVCVDGVWTMVRTLDALDKDLLSLKPDSQQDLWITEIGKMGRIVLAGVPLFQAFYQAFPSLQDARRRDTTIHEGWLYRMSKRMELNTREPSAETRMSFYLAFGVDPYTQKVLEERYAKFVFTRTGQASCADCHDVRMEWGSWN